MAYARIDELVEETRSRQAQPLTPRERVTAGAMATAFLVLAVPLALHAAPGAARLPAILLFAALYAAASVVEFEVGTGAAVPTQLVLVPMLFVLPLGVVPLVAACGFVAGDLVRAAFRTGERAVPLTLIGSSWYATGPTVVLMLAGGGPPAWNRWPVYAAAFAAQFACDAGSTIVADAVALGVRPSLSVRAVGWAYGIDALLAPVGLAVAMLAVNDTAAALVALPLVVVIALFARDRRARTDALIDLSRTYRGTALVLGDVIEADDTYTGTHSRNVLDLSLAVADELRLDPTARRAVEFTSLLHDIGKLRIPNSVINKPGALTPAEWALINTHTIEGERILGQIGGFLGDVGAIVRSCHERWDGGGYPDGLAAEAIPMPARIVSCCDAFDAITSDRPYRKARSADVALAELISGSGSQFDPAVVRAVQTILSRRGVTATRRRLAA
jgi:HD-GYP domain-containing protein (c-di-GMP phosphodiesterase class II)